MSRYSLEKHPKPKGICPHCGEKKVFRFFQDADGNRLDEQFGICDRKAKCGYDYRPSGELFTTAGDAAEKPAVETILALTDLAEALLAKTKDYSSNLHRYARTLTVPAEHLEKWAVATDRDRSVYLHLNGDKQLVNAKWFKYQEDGRRDKNTQPYSLAQPSEAEHKRYGFCFYGEHLLRHEDPARPICVVESEKSAVLASFAYPHLDWLACGSANGITDEKISALYNRPIWWVADADGNVPLVKDGQPVLKNGKPQLTEGGRRNSSLRKLKSYGLDFVVLDLFPERTDGYDIADALRDGVRPDVVAPAPPKKKKREELPADVAAWSTQRKDQYQKTQEFVAEFLRREINLTANSEDWDNVVNSLAIFGEHGRELAHTLARPARLYKKEDVDKRFDQAVEEAICNSPVKLFNIGKHYKISLRELKDKDAARNEVADVLPPGVKPEDYFQHGFYEQDNCYYSIKDGVPRMVCGFTIKVLYLVKSKLNPKRIVELKNQFGYKTTLDLPTDAFTGLGQFKKCVESAGNFVFEGNETDLTRLKKKLFREEKLTQEISTLGHQTRGNFFAFANGIYNGKWTGIDEYGIVEHDGSNYYLPFLSSINNDDQQNMANEKKFVHKPCELNFEQWADLMHKVYGSNGMMGVCFYIAALYRDIVFDQLNAFPLLFCFGERQSGKTKYTDSFKPLFGQPQDSLSLENPSTTIGMSRTLANFSNTIVMLDEYKNSVDKRTIGLLKGLWDGFGRITGVKSNDNQTKTTRPLSSVILSGQDMPTIDNALFTRCILLEFRDKARDYANYELLKRLEKQGQSGITIELLGFRSQMEVVFRETFQRVLKYLKDHLRGEGIEDRMLQNMATILAPAYHLIEKDRLKFPVESLELFDMAIKLIRRQHAQISSSTDARRFWDVFVGMANAKPYPQIIEGQDYRFVKGILYIRLGNIHPTYLKEHRSQYNVPGQDKQTIDYYLKNDAAFVGQKNLRFDMPSGAVLVKTTPTSAYGFDFAKLGIELQQLMGEEQE